MARRDDDDDDDDRDDDDEDDDDRKSSRRRRTPSKDDKQMAMFCHLGGILGIILPLVLWITQKEKSAFIDDQGKEAVNFGLTMMIGHVLGICTFGILNLILLPIGLIFHIIAGMAAGRGEKYRYPMSIRFIK
jgi:uncharacterized Tic20 family protein